MNLDEYARMYAAEDSHWWYVGMRDATLGLLNGHLDNAAAEARRQGDSHRPRILDAGCGTGGLLMHLDAMGWTAGIDLSPTALAFARYRDLPHLAEASVESLPFPDATYDLVTCMDVLYHLQVHEDTTALAEFHRVLRPGGFFLFADLREVAEMPKLQALIAAQKGLEIVEQEDITAMVLAALRGDEQRKRAMIDDLVPANQRALFDEFAGLEGSKIMNGLESRSIVYHRFVVKRV